MGSIRTLSISHLYPDKKTRRVDKFVSSQVEKLVTFGFASDVISPSPWYPKFLNKINFLKVYMPPESSPSSYHNDIHVIRLPYFRIPKGMGYKTLWKFYKKIISRCLIKSLAFVPEKDNLQLLHVHFGQYGVAALPLQRKLGIPMIVTFYGHDVLSLYEKNKKIYGPLIDSNCLCLAISNDMAKDLHKIGFSNVETWNLGIDVDKFKKPKNPKRDKNVNFLTAVRFVEKKGIEYLIRAFHKVYMNYKNVRLTILGRGPLKKNLVNLSKNLDLNQVVNFKDNFSDDNPHKTVLKYMNASDVFILPSITAKNGDKEGTPVVLMEAQACGLPCISTFHAGIPEVVIDGETGWLVPEKDIDVLSKKMEWFVKNPNELISFGNRARTHIKLNYNINVQIKKLSEIYKKVIS